MVLLSDKGEAGGFVTAQLLWDVFKARFGTGTGGAAALAVFLLAMILCVCTSHASASLSPCLIIA